MPLSYLYVYDLCFIISRPSGGDVSAKVRKIFIPASDPKNSFSRSARPDLCRSLRSVSLSALRVQRYNFSHSPQVLSQKFLKEISHLSDIQPKKNPPRRSTPLPETQSETPLPSGLTLIPVLVMSITAITHLYYR